MRLISLSELSWLLGSLSLYTTEVSDKYLLRSFLRNSFSGAPRLQLFCGVIVSQAKHFLTLDWGNNHYRWYLRLHSAGIRQNPTAQRCNSDGILALMVRTLYNTRSANSGKVTPSQKPGFCIFSSADDHYPFLVESRSCPRAKKAFSPT